ncbi:unnamed protein product [Absidia cylindrospora]
MRLVVVSLLSIVLLFAGQISGNTIATEAKLTEVVLTRRDGMAVAANQGHQSGTNSTTTNARSTAIWASPAILEKGTFFYIAISISTLLWCTGKAVDMTLDQQERQAEFLARR